MKCISAVSTPLQLLNCIEFVCHNNITEHTLLIFAASPKRLSQIQGVLELPYVSSKIKNLHVLLDNGNGISYYIKTLLNRVRARFYFCGTKYDYCVICNYHIIAHRNLFRLASSNPNTKLIHLDDGLAIADCVELRKRELNTGKPILTCSRSDRYLYNFGINKYVPKSIHFFTPYQVQIEEVDSYQRNDYSYLKSQILSNNNDLTLSGASAIILGQPIVADSLLTQQQYSDCLEKVLESYVIAEGQLFYLPHPVENVDLSLGEKLKNKVTIFRSGLPFELLSMSINSNATVIGFYTAALSCIKNLDINCRVCAIHPRFNYKSEEEEHVIETAYLYLRKIGIKEIEL